MVTPPDNEKNQVTLPIAEVVLRDGRRVRFRPIRPDDRDRWLDFFNRMSPAARYMRFQYAKKTATDMEIANFINVVPPARAAYVATTGYGDSERIMAIGRWDETGSRRAEVAFAVAEDMQSRGVGTALLEHLADAAMRFDFATFEAQVLAENESMLGVFDRSGLRTRITRERGGVVHYEIDLTEDEEFQRRRAEREHIARAAGIRRLMHPHNIAVIGASRRHGSVGNVIFKNLLSGGFTGTVFPVNRSAKSVDGVLAYPSVLDIPAEVDLAIIVVPAEHVSDVVDECARKAVWGLVVVSAGFSETGERGAELEHQLKEKVLSYGGRLIGPNCLGVINNADGVSMNASFAPTHAGTGRVSMGSQSGALGLALLDYANSIGMGVAQFVSIGNRADVSSNDLLEYWEDDPDTDIILLYLESFGNPRKFGRIARRASRRKPIIAVKGGRSAVGAKAASSHTASLAGSETAAEALFNRSGVIRVDSIEEMFGAARVLNYQPIPRGKRVGIVTNAGGPGILAADACESWGLEVPPVSESSRSKLKGFLPSSASLQNPVDMIASATPEHYERTVQVLLGDDGLDMILVIYVPPVVTTPEEVAGALSRLDLSDSDKTVVASFMMYGQAPAMVSTASSVKIPSFTFPENAVRGLHHACEYASFREQAEGRVPKFTDVAEEAANDIAAVEKKSWLTPEDALRILELYGIPIAKSSAAETEDEAAARSVDIGFPVAMKLRSRTIVHKTDVGGIQLNLNSEAEVRRAFRQIRDRMRAAGREADMEGVVVQQMVTGGREVIVGMAQDPLFGPVVMTGLGGVEVELLKDVSFSLHPLTDQDPDRMLSQLKTLPLLTGWRGSTERDVDALKQVLLRFSALIEDVPELDTFEINPLMVLEKGRGCVAVDARVLVDPERRWHTT